MGGKGGEGGKKIPEIMPIIAVTTPGGPRALLIVGIGKVG